MKKLISVVMVLAIVFSSVAAMSVTASALTFTDSGDCTANNYEGTVKWTLSVDTKTDQMKLVISGDGHMNNEDIYPWLKKEAIWAALYGAKLTEVVVEEGVKAIGEQAFAGETSLSKVTLPSTLETVGDYAFAATALKSITIPKSTTNFSANAMASCPNFTEFIVDTDNTAYKSVNGMLLSKDGAVLVAYPAMLFDKNVSTVNTALAIPETVKTIGSYAFAGAAVFYVTIPENVKTLANMSFYGSAVEWVRIENGLEKIGDSAFLECSFLKSIYIPESVKEIGYLSMGVVEELDTTSIKDLLNDAGAEYTDNADTDWEALISEYLPNYAIDEFKTHYTDPNFTIYGKSGSTAENYAGGVFPTPVKFTHSSVCPAFLLSVSGSKGTIKLEWQKSTEADGYYIYRRSNSGKWSKVASVSDVSSWTDSSPVSGVMNSYAVVAYNSNGENKSAYEPSSDFYYLATPKLVSTKNTGSSVYVTWGAVKGAEYYSIYRKLSGASKWTKVKNISASKTSYSDTDIKNGKLYTYTVRAYKIFDAKKVDWSKTNIRSILGEDFDYTRIFNDDFDYDAYYNGTIDMADYLDGITLKCISYYNTKGISSKFITSPKLSGTVNEGSGVRVNWKAVSGAEGYYIYRKAGNASSWTKIATVKGGSKNTYKDKTTKSGVTYTYTVRAYSKGYMSSYYSGVKTTFLSMPNLSSAKKASNGIKITYTKSVGATGYKIYRKTANSGWQRIATVKGVSKLSYLDKSAKKGVKYTYTVRSYNGNYLSAFNAGGISCKR